MFCSSVIFYQRSMSCLHWSTFTLAITWIRLIQVWQIVVDEDGSLVQVFFCFQRDVRLLKFMGSLPNNRSLKCHATLPEEELRGVLRDIFKNGYKG